jgi:Fe2+ transport system protein FeoA
MTTERQIKGLHDMKEKQTGSIAAYGRAILNDPVAIRVIATPLTLHNNEADYISVQIRRN